MQNDEWGKRLNVLKLVTCSSHLGSTSDSFNAVAVLIQTYPRYKGNLKERVLGCWCSDTKFQDFKIFSKVDKRNELDHIFVHISDQYHNAVNNKMTSLYKKVCKSKIGT